MKTPPGDRQIPKEAGPSQDQESLLRRALMCLGEAVLVADQDATVVFVNKAFEALSGYREQEMVGSSLAEVLHSSGLQTVKAIGPDEGTLGPGGPTRHEGNAFIISKAGQQIFVAETLSCIQDRGGRVSGIAVILHPNPTGQGAAKTPPDLDSRDALTGLLTRRHLEAELASERVLHDASLGLILCDVNGLKVVNDSMGHKAGDAILVAAANALRQSFRKEDTIARIGGDEFAILLPGNSLGELKSACTRIKENVSSFNKGNKGLPLSVSLGYAWTDTKDLNFPDLFAQADQHMYREKRQDNQRNKQLAVNTIMEILNTRDFARKCHCEPLVPLAESMAHSLKLTDGETRELILLAEFHDIGKINIPEDILSKTEPLSPKEAETMRKHCEIGEHIAMASPDLAPVAGLILRHHECWNGEGYPLGLKGEEIPLPCRVFSIVHTYTKLLTHRPYQQAVSRQEARDFLVREAGIRFDPILVAHFLQLTDSLSIFAAISTQEVMKDLTQHYLEERPGKSITLRFDSTGGLKNRIENGSLCDIYVSAAEWAMDELQRMNFLKRDSRKVIFHNRIVLATQRSSILSCGISDLKADYITKIAIGDPKTVPAGEYAHEVLSRLEVLEDIQGKFVFGKDAHKVLEYVETGCVDVGIVYETDAIASGKVRIVNPIAEAGASSMATYESAIIRGSGHAEDARDFLRFLSSEASKEIFRKHGFTS